MVGSSASNRSVSHRRFSASGARLAGRASPSDPPILESCARRGDRIPREFQDCVSSASRTVTGLSKVSGLDHCGPQRDTRERCAASPENFTSSGFFAAALSDSAGPNTTRPESLEVAVSCSGVEVGQSVPGLSDLAVRVDITSSDSSCKPWALAPKVQGVCDNQAQRTRRESWKFLD